MIESNDFSAAIDQLRSIYSAATVVKHNGRLITVNAFTDQTVPLSPRTLAGIARAVSIRLDGLNYDVVLGEEDKGGHIATAVSLATDKPLLLARWYTYRLQEVHSHSVVVPVESEYFCGQLLVNGVSRGMRVVVVEDTISTGGTLAALINAVRRRGADVLKAIAVVEKAGVGGVDFVAAATGVHVESLVQIRVSEAGVSVLDA